MRGRFVAATALAALALGLLMPGISAGDSITSYSVSLEDDPSGDNGVSLNQGSSSGLVYKFDGTPQIASLSRFQVLANPAISDSRLGLFQVDTLTPTSSNDANDDGNGTSKYKLKLTVTTSSGSGTMTLNGMTAGSMDWGGHDVGKPTTPYWIVALSTTLGFSAADNPNSPFHLVGNQIQGMIGNDLVTLTLPGTSNLPPANSKNEYAPVGGNSVRVYDPTTDKFGDQVVDNVAVSFSVVPTPEPSTMVVVGLGLLGLLAVRRRAALG